MEETQKNGKLVSIFDLKDFHVRISFQYDNGETPFQFRQIFGGGWAVPPSSPLLLHSLPCMSPATAHSSFWRAVGPSLSSRQLSPPSLLIAVKWEALPLLQGSLQSLVKAHARVCELDSSSVTVFPLVPFTWEGLRLSADPWKTQQNTA